MTRDTEQPTVRPPAEGVIQPPAAAIARGRTRLVRSASFALENVVWFLLVAVCIVAGSQNSFFLTIPNLQNILVQATVLGFLSLGVTFTLLLGEIDLSIVGTLVFTGVVGALTMRDHGTPGAIALILMLLCGAAIGLVNGVSVAYLRANSLIETLAVGLILGGAVLALTKGQNIAVSDSKFLYMGSQTFGTWPVMPAALVVVYGVAWVVLTRSPFGRRLYATGGNVRASVAAGIRVKRVRMVAFVVSGLLAGAAGVLETSYLAGINSTVGSTILLYAVAAPVIGGISLQGGRGRVIGLFGGVLLITVIQVALQIVNISAYYVQIAGGAIIFIAVMFDSLRLRLKER
jgi:simple sugar transport system permease protein